MLRIEDTDQVRSTRESEASMLEDLRWLGLDWDEGPDIGGEHGPYRASDRLHLYESYATELLTAGTAYRCFCSPELLESERKAAVAAGLPARYSGRCRPLTGDEAAARMAAGERPAIRFACPTTARSPSPTPCVARSAFTPTTSATRSSSRADGMPAYNFAVVVDDALMAMTLVIRGEDHVSNTPRQVLLYQALGFDVPTFAHLSMVLGPITARCRSGGAASVSEFRSRGLFRNRCQLPHASAGRREAATVAAARRAGPAICPRSCRAPACSTRARVGEPALPQGGGFVAREPVAAVFCRASVAIDANRPASVLASVMPIASGSVDRLDQVPARLAFLFDYSPERTLTDAVILDEMTAEGPTRVVEALAQELEASPRLDRERFREVANRVKAKTNQKARALFHPIRIAR